MSQEYPIRELCAVLAVTRSGYYATFSSSFDSGWPVPGRIGIASQSGAYGTHLYTLARNRRIGALRTIHAPTRSPSLAQPQTAGLHNPQ